MDAEIKRKWVEALRSGNYQQGRNHLHRDNKFCCLGVLCQITTGKMGYEQTRKHFPVKMEHDLIGMNDDGKSFAEIADYIERNL